MPRASLLFAALAAAAGLAAPAAACSVSATGVNFGAYSTIDPAPHDGVGTVVIRCHPNVHNPEVGVGAGNSGSFAVRWLRNGAQRLNYNLYTTAARALILGDGTGGSSTIGAGDGSVSAGTRTIEVPIYGRIAPLQGVGEGTYSDTLFVTVTF